MGYRVGVDREENMRQRHSVGLCADCEYARQVGSSRQSTFYLCERSTDDPSFPKYPSLPVITCAGYVRSEPEGPIGTRSA